MKRPALALLILLAALLAGGATRVVQDQCGPFTDVTPGFCPYVLELYYLGITVGTSATTFSPDDPLTRGQGAVFIAKGLNQSLARSSRRAALGQWAIPKTADALARTTVGRFPVAVRSDGADVWVADQGGSVSRIRGSDGRFVDFWTGAVGASDILVAMGRIFVLTYGGDLDMLDPSQPPGAVTTVASLGEGQFAMTFDGSRIWVAGSLIVSIVTPGPTLPWSVQTLGIQDFESKGVVFDGANVWLSGEYFGITGALYKLDSEGAVLQTVFVGQGPSWPTFDGANIWTLNVGENEPTLSVVQAASGSVVATLSGNGMSGGPYGAAFDGERMLISTFTSLSVWNAASLAPIGFVPVSSPDWPVGVCGDGINFWIAMSTAGQLARF